MEAISKSFEFNAPCIRNGFNPSDINGEDVAEYFGRVAENLESLRKFRFILVSNKNLLASFLRYWAMQKEPDLVKPRSNVLRILHSK